MEVSISGGDPNNGWLIKGYAIQLDDFGVPPILGNNHIASLGPADHEVPRYVGRHIFSGSNIASQPQCDMKLQISCVMHPHNFERQSHSA